MWGTTHRMPVKTAIAAPLPRPTSHQLQRLVGQKTGAARSKTSTNSSQCPSSPTCPSPGEIPPDPGAFLWYGHLGSHVRRRWPTFAPSYFWPHTSPRRTCRGQRPNVATGRSPGELRYFFAPHRWFPTPTPAAGDTVRPVVEAVCRDFLPVSAKRPNQPVRPGLLHVSDWARVARWTNYLAKSSACPKSTAFPTSTQKSPAMYKLAVWIATQCG